MQRTIELIQSFPQLPLWAALSAAIDPNLPVERRFLLITVVLSLVTWTGLAREVRGKVLAFRNADYTAAARAAGGSHRRIILTHMIPNSLSHIIVVATLAVPATILGETSLSFLGLGILPPRGELGCAPARGAAGDERDQVPLAAHSRRGRGARRTVL